MERQVYTDHVLYEDTHWWFVSRRAIIKGVLDRYCRKRRQNMILEIGCGSGGNLEMLSQYGRLFAVELDDKVRQIALDRNLCVVREGDLPNNLPFQELFDVICTFDVVEHIDDDIGAVLAIAKKLSSGGKLIITVPAYAFLWSSHDVVNQHKRRYTRKQLVNLVKSAGLTVEYVTYFNFFLFPLVLIGKILNNISGSKKSHLEQGTSSVQNSILRTIFSFEKRLVPKLVFPFGVSILLVARK